MSRGQWGIGRRPRVGGVDMTGELTSLLVDADAEAGSVAGVASKVSGAKIAFNTSGPVDNELAAEFRAR
jgi:hypothetical protein